MAFQFENTELPGERGSGLFKAPSSKIPLELQLQ